MRLARQNNRPHLPRTYHFAIGHCQLGRNSEKSEGEEEELTDTRELFNRMFENPG